tara:strand:+ start:566 stop:745 length:180 start_codon:yes stop_codon:yes gene_type:complete
METVKQFFRNIKWKRLGKIALVIIPVLAFEAWYHTLSLVWKGTEWVSVKGERVLGDFLG